MSLFNHHGRTLLLAATAAVAFFASPSNAQTAKPAAAKPASTAGTLTDARNGRAYKTVKIGNQTWMAENLNFQTANGSWCYNNDANKCREYGRLYDWNAAMGGKASSTENPSGVQGACPAGWHLPSRAEWTELAKTAGGTGADGATGIAGERLKAKNGGWENNGNGTDNYGFSALPGGWRNDNGGFHKNVRYSGSWWTSTSNNGLGRFRRMGATDEFVASLVADNNKNGFSVRCVMDVAKAKTDSVQQKADGGAKKDSAAAGGGGTFTDTRDNKTYKTVKIGGKNWMAENLNYKPSTGESWCYDNKVSNCNRYGRLYDWNTAKGVCPSGWNLPTDDEWDALVSAAGGGEVAGKALKSVAGGWVDNGNGTDSYGFSALPGGLRTSDGSFIYADSAVGWWTATATESGNASARSVSYNFDRVKDGHDDKSFGLSVRCIQK
jgi:uncharacterized protein (TIGR02145 family)